MAELAGVMVGNYFLLECLDREGMVETYLARPTTHGGYDVHLRLFRPVFPDPGAFQEHFPTEVRKVWRCQHAHIQPLVEFGEGDDLLYTATRADAAPTLARLLERQGDALLPLHLIANLLVQLCDALEYSHDCEIVHGNLQPSSILINQSGEASLTNFALKQAYQEGDPLVAQIEEGNVAYVAPEQVVGKLTSASDIYALGVLLYRLLTGILPYDGESAGETAMLHASEPIPELRPLRPNLPEAAEQVVQIALAKDPAERFTTPGALATAFMRALAGESSTDANAPVVAATHPRRIAVKAWRTDLTWSRAFSLLALVLIIVGFGSTFYLFSFSSVKALPGFPLHQTSLPGVLSLNLPPLGPGGFPTPTPGQVIAAAQPTPTPGQRAQPTPAQHARPTPGVTPTINVQQTPIITLATPSASPTAVPTSTTSLTCVPGSLTIDGSSYLAPLLQQVGSDYQTICPGLSLTVGAHGELAGLKALVGGQANLAATELSVKTTTQMLTDYPTLALLYAVIVSPDIQLSNLSSQQLQAIYHGQVTNWSQLGGPAEPIQVVLHGSSDPLKAIFQAFVLNGQPESVQGIPPLKRTPEALVQQVAQLAGAITYVPLAVAGAANVNVLSIDGAQPSMRDLLQGNYPFWSVAHLYAQGSATVQAQAYLQFLQAPPEANRLAQFGAVACNLLTPDVLNSHLPGPEVSL